MSRLTSSNKTERNSISNFEYFPLNIGEILSHQNPLQVGSSGLQMDCKSIGYASIKKKNKIIIILSLWVFNASVKSTEQYRLLQKLYSSGHFCLLPLHSSLQ